MSSPRTNIVRLVIQLVEEGSPPRSIYRLVAYPPLEGMSLRPVKFSSREKLVEQLSAVLPGFDHTRLGTGLTTQIIFAEDVELSSSQLLALGLAR